MIARGWCLALLLLTACRTLDPVTGRKTRNFWSVQDDIRLGEDFIQDVRKWAKENGLPINKDPEKVALLERMMRDIAAVSHYPDLPYEVLLVHTNTVNAMALPGGKIVVFEGLFDPRNGLVRDEDELAVVMAHEIAHVNCRHSTRALTRTLPWNLLMLGGMIYAEIKDEDDLQAVFEGAFVIYNGLVVTRHSRRDEREADRVGLLYMARAGYDPQAAVRLWRRWRPRGSLPMPGWRRRAGLPHGSSRLTGSWKNARSAHAAAG